MIASARRRFAWLAAATELAWIRLSLRLLPAATVLAAVRLPAPPGTRGTSPEAQFLEAFAAAARQRWLRMTCLPRAIALKRLLVRRGYDARLVIGFARRDPPAGHAWVEVGGQPVLEDAAVARVYSFRLREETLLEYSFVSSSRIDFGGSGDPERRA